MAEAGQGDCPSKLAEGKGNYSCSTVRDLPDSTSKWLRNEEIKTHVFRVFKTRRLKIDVEKIFWPYSVSGMDCDIWFRALEDCHQYEMFQDFFSVCLAPIDLDPDEWFHHNGEEKAESDLVEQTRTLMMAVMASRHEYLRKNNYTDGNQFISQMNKEFKYWIASLTHLLRKSPSRLNESAYEHLFEAFVQLFGLRCTPGDLEKLEIPYEVRSGERTVTRIRSKPDLILYRYDEVPNKFVNAVPLAVIQVKGISQSKQPKKAHRGSRKRVLSAAEKQMSGGMAAFKTDLRIQPAESRAKCVRLENDNLSDFETVAFTGPEAPKEEAIPGVTAAPGPSCAPTPDTSCSYADQIMSDLQREHLTASSKDEQIAYEEVDYGDLPSHAEIPSHEEKQSWNKFLPQLLGEVVAVGSLQDEGDKRSSIGIAVDGYSVTFLNFCCQRSHHFDDIPKTPSAGMDIFISQRLSLLKKMDREKICKTLLYLATFNLPF